MKWQGCPTFVAKMRMHAILDAEVGDAKECFQPHDDILGYEGLVGNVEQRTLEQGEVLGDINDGEEGDWLSTLSPLLLLE